MKLDDVNQWISGCSVEKYDVDELAADLACQVQQDDRVFTEGS